MSGVRIGAHCIQCICHNTIEMHVCMKRPQLDWCMHCGQEIRIQMYGCTPFKPCYRSCPYRTKNFGFVVNQSESIVVLLLFNYLYFTVYGTSKGLKTGKSINLSLCFWPKGRDKIYEPELIHTLLKGVDWNALKMRFLGGKTWCVLNSFFKLFSSSLKYGCSNSSISLDFHPGSVSKSDKLPNSTGSTKWMHEKIYCYYLREIYYLLPPALVVNDIDTVPSDLVSVCLSVSQFNRFN